MLIYRILHIEVDFVLRNWLIWLVPISTLSLYHMYIDDLRGNLWIIFKLCFQLSIRQRANHGSYHQQFLSSTEVGALHHISMCIAEVSEWEWLIEGSLHASLSLSGLLLGYPLILNTIIFIERDF